MRLSSFTTPGRLSLVRLVVVLAAVTVALVAWVAVLVATDIDQGFEQTQAEAQAANLALVFEEQVYRQILTVDQTLRIFKLDWEQDPQSFDFASLQRRVGSTSDAVSRVLVLNYQGRVIDGTIPELTNADFSDRRYFRAHRDSDSFDMLVDGPVQRNGQWSLEISRRLNGPHNVFAGVVVASYDLSALMRDMSQADLGSHGLVMLVGRDGVVNALFDRGANEPGMNIAASPLYHAMFDGMHSTWAGPSPVDGVERIHAFRTVPQQGLTLVVGLDKAEALAPAQTRRQQAVIGASAVTLLVVLLAFGVGSMVAGASEREERLAEDRAVLEAANAQLARARERADEKTQQLSMTLASMSDGVVMYDANMRLMLWNDQASELTGTPREAVRAGVLFEDLLRAQAERGEFGPRWDESHLQQRLAAARALTGTSVMERVRPNGSVIELRRTRLPQGGWVTLYTDITARKQAEAAQGRARELAEIGAQEKSRFVAIVSHEIRTPLNVALNALALLDHSSLTTAQRHLVETGLLAGDSLMGLLNDILDLSRMQVGRLSLRPAPFLLHPLLNGLVEMFRNQAAERGVTLSVYVAPGVPDRLMTDAARLRQVLMNLLSNAAKFSMPGPASIRVDFATLGAAPVLRLAVRDPGPEIPDLDRARLFRPFSQLEQPRRGDGGTGLGLAICQLLANLLGGEVGCDGVEGGGKEFWLTLPADVMDVPTETPPSPLEPGQRWLPRTRVLLVEDVPANQMIVATLLRREGHSVDVAGSGLSALTMLTERPYDLVLLDIFMPGIDGLETVRRVRVLSGLAAEVKVVALTANVAPEDRANYLAAGMDDLVSKPVNRTALLSALSRHVWPGRRTHIVAPTVATPVVRPVPGAVLDRQRVESWRAGLPTAVSDRLFQDCLRQLRDMLPALEAALTLRDEAAVKRVTHAFGGVAGNYGLSALEALMHAIATDSLGPPFDPHQEIKAVEDAIGQAELAVQALVETAMV